MSDPSTWYADIDGDSYGDPTLSTEACEAPARTVSDGTDCDDGDAAIHPAATEQCSGVDDDCDGLTDDDDPDVTGTTTSYLDFDGDGYGNASYSHVSCEVPTGYVENSDDCDDGHSEASPSGSEVCDGLDNDCDGSVDVGASDEDTFYADSDGDGFGDAASTATGCSAPTDHVADSSDCDDTDANTNPDGTEVCAAGDEDCDGLEGDDDPDVSDPTTWTIDYDGDGHGDEGSSYTASACEQPSGYAESADDCDDLDGAINPSATEACNGYDDDCDGAVDGDDPDLPGGSMTTWYLDDDGDSYGDPASSTEACEGPSGYVANDQDCDDTEPEAWTGRSEICDGIDNDCSGSADDDSGLTGTGEACPAIDCQEVLDLGNTADGNYWIDPDGSGSFEIFCDLTREGGGWTLVAHVDDVSDPYFGAQQSEPWETDSVRNETTLPSHSTDISVSAKYASWSSIDVTDVYVFYKNSGGYFLCEGVTVTDTLDAIFAMSPSPDTCSAECTSYSEDIMPEGSITPVGLNCSDGNEGWMEAVTAENARIGARSDPHYCCVYNAWLGAAGDRGFATSNTEKTWAAYSSGAEHDDNIMVFVR